MLYLCLLGGFVCASEEVDYNSLDPSYYQYIKMHPGATYKDIAKLIKNIQEANKKTGLFIGINVAALNNNVANDAIRDYLFGYGAKFGYQTFLPSSFDSLFLPNYVGRRIYVQYLGTIGKEEPLGKMSYSSITLNGDLMIDLPIYGGFSAGMIAGIGLGSMVHGYDANSQFVAMVNTGIGITFFSKNRLEFELKLVTDKEVQWFGALFSVGYQYVF
ncbi:hypothetical protein BKH45_01430 [Helicobacter sp. 11S03491-1]|nr:hypothetical protein BKH45_01430 [Helicobacter sp. 11S03491-1]